MNTNGDTHIRTRRIRTALVTSALGLGLLSACGEAPAETRQATAPTPTEAPVTTVQPVSADAAEHWTESDTSEASTSPMSPDAAERWAANDGTDDLPR